MRLGPFINDNMDAIVRDSIAFAGTALPAAELLSEAALSHHSRAILRGIALELEGGRAVVRPAAARRLDEVGPAAPDTPARAHGAVRQAAGFDLMQVIGEFSSLRTNVVRLWRRSCVAGERAEAIDRIDDMDDIVRFQHAIDQALTEAVQRYVADMRRASDTFLAALAHDLRNPLSVIEASSHLLATQTLAAPIRQQATLRVWRSARVMNGLITDFLAYARTRLGRGIPVARSACNLRRLCEDAIEALRTVHPQRELTHALGGDLVIQADAPRLQQVLWNLLGNALQHGDDRAPVLLEARGDAEGIVLRISNSVSTKASEALQRVLEPVMQVPVPGSAFHGRERTGLGLSIVREIVRGHEGEMSAECSPAGRALFTIRLPRVPSEAGLAA